MIQVPFRELAQRELGAAVARCDRERPGTGKLLREEVEDTALRIATAPLQGSPYLFGTRRFILHRSPYSTVYVTLESGYVVAVAHFKRKPGYWRRRLKDIR
jgi:hypothetical protein